MWRVLPLQLIFVEMKHTMIWTLCTAAALSMGCGNADAPASTKTANDKAATASETPTPAAGQPDVTVSAKWKSGVTEANDGDKVGKVRLHGSMPAGNGTVLYLYETEGRNLTLMDSTKVMNQAFDFGQVEVHRGFYQLAGTNAKNNCQFVMNPDESDLNLVFRSKMMTSGKSAPASAENRTWFTYENFSRANNNQIRGLASNSRTARSARKSRSKLPTRKWNWWPSSTN